MEKNEVKKELYKQKPMARLILIRKGVAHYASILEGNGPDTEVRFEVPISDMGDADFFSFMEAKLLIRYLVHDTGVAQLVEQ